jgi:hypothetical protein
MDGQEHMAEAGAAAEAAQHSTAHSVLLGGGEGRDHYFVRGSIRPSRRLQRTNGRAAPRARSK